MRVRKFVLAGAALAAAVSATPAAADPTLATGFNTGDAGVISLTTNGLAASSDSPGHGVLDAKCEYHQVTRPSSNEVVLVVAGHAVAGPRGAERAIATTVRCRLLNAFTNAVVFDRTIGNESTANVWVPQTQTGYATSYVVCAEAKALYSDGAYVVTDQMHCLRPF